MLILDLWGISFHAVIVFALGKNLLFKFALGRCDPALCSVELGDKELFGHLKIVS